MGVRTRRDYDWHAGIVHEEYRSWQEGKLCQQCRKPMDASVYWHRLRLIDGGFLRRYRRVCRGCAQQKHRELQAAG